MSAVRNARKKGVSKPVRSPIRERGRVKHGEKREIVFFWETRSVPTVNHILEYRIIPLLRSMGDQNISISKIPSPCVSLVIEVAIAEDTDVQTAARLALNRKIQSAMVACLEVIESELFTEESIDKESGTKSNLIKINLPTNGRKKDEAPPGLFYENERERL